MSVCSLGDGGGKKQKGRKKGSGGSLEKTACRVAYESLGDRLCTMARLEVAVEEQGLGETVRINGDG